MTQLFPWDIFSKGMMDLLESEDGQLLDNYRYAIANTANAMSSKSLDDPMEGPCGTRRGRGFWCLYRRTDIQMATPRWGTSHTSPEGLYHYGVGGRFAVVDDDIARGSI